MNKKNQVEQNIELAFDFIKKVINNPAILDKIEDNSKIIITLEKNRSSKMKDKSKRKELTNKKGLAFSK